MHQKSFAFHLATVAEGIIFHRKYMLLGNLSGTI